MPTLESSNLNSFTYNPATEALSITFSRGDVYTYWNVPVDVVVSLSTEGGSVGQNFNMNIRGVYAFTRRTRSGRFQYRRSFGN